MESIKPNQSNEESDSKCELKEANNNRLRDIQRILGKLSNSRDMLVELLQLLVPTPTFVR